VTVPVLVLGFNRADKVRAVLSAVHAGEPSAIYFVVDGPREGRDEETKVAEVQAVIAEFRWECPVHTVFYENNLGVKRAMSESLDWFFSNESMGAVLEDDCLPSPDFFRFIAQSLVKYRDYSNVGMVAGTNFLGSVRRGRYDAIFSEGHIWGWATWSDRWQHHRRTRFAVSDVVNAPAYYGIGWPYRRRLAESAEQGRLDSWAIPWLLFLAESKLYCAIPTKNLVSNVGHGADSTHTSGRSRFANLQARAMPAVIDLPDVVTPDLMYQARYAVGLHVEHALHSARRPAVGALRGSMTKLRGLVRGSK
jgi:hypothetical protein